MRISRREDLNLGPEYQYPCRRCNIVKHISNFSAVHMKQWLRKVRREETWACEDCQFPACCLCSTENRPLYPVSHNAVRDGKYLCEEHRFPPCIECGRPRPEGRKKLRIVDWRCEECRNRGDVQCCKCLQFKSWQEFDLRKESTNRTCRACQHPPCQCYKCLQFKSRQEFDDLRNNSTRRTCRACLHPPCHRCGTPLAEVWRRGEKVRPYCSTECRLPPCSNGTCEQPRPYRLWFHLCPEWQCQACKGVKKQ